MDPTKGNFGTRFGVRRELLFLVEFSRASPDAWYPGTAIQAVKGDNAKGVGAHSETLRQYNATGVAELVLCLVAHPMSRVTTAAIGLAGHCGRVSREQRRCNQVCRCMRCNQGARGYPLPRYRGTWRAANVSELGTRCLVCSWHKIFF